MSLLTTFLGD